MFVFIELIIVSIFFMIDVYEFVQWWIIIETLYIW